MEEERKFWPGGTIPSVPEEGGDKAEIGEEGLFSTAGVKRRWTAEIDRVTQSLSASWKKTGFAPPTTLPRPSWSRGDSW